MIQRFLRQVLAFGGFVDPVRERGVAMLERPVEPSVQPIIEPPSVHRAPRVPVLAEACRRYQEAAIAWRLGRLDPEDLARLRLAMGPDLYSWVRVQVLTGDRYTWRPTQGADPDGKRQSAGQEMRRDLARWERALIELDRQAATARRLKRPAPEPLEVPRDIRAALEARRRAAEERAARRASARVKAGAGAEDGGEAPQLDPPALRRPR
ncbi:MAG: hypothetical protein PGN33_01790 [Methylobacterium radiotolerans]